MIWAFAECAVSIMAASIPALRVLVSSGRGDSYPRHMPSLSVNVSATKPGGRSKVTATTASISGLRRDDQDTSSLDSGRQQDSNWDGTESTATQMDQSQSMREFELHIV